MAGLMVFKSLAEALQSGLSGLRPYCGRISGQDAHGRRLGHGSRSPVR